VVHRGQIWINTKTNEPRFVCGTNEEWLWHTALDFSPRRTQQRYTGEPWKKDKIEHFEKRYTFTKTAIAPNGFWKSKATGMAVTILAIKDDGWRQIYVLYDLNKMALNDFYEYFEPCTRIETLVSLSRQRKAIRKTKKRIALSKGRYYYTEEE